MISKILNILFFTILVVVVNGTLIAQHEGLTTSKAISNSSLIAESINSDHFSSIEGSQRIVFGTNSAIHFTPDFNITTMLRPDESFSFVPFTFTDKIIIGNSNPFTGNRLSIVSGSDVAPSQGGYAVFGNEGSANLAIDNNEIMARTDSSFSTLFLQDNGGNLSILNNGVGAGGVSIGHNAPSHILHVNGVARSFQSAWATSSDRRVKQDIHTIKNANELISQLRPVSYRWNQNYREDSEVHLGFIAQEIESVMPNWVDQVEEKYGDTKIDDFRVINISELTPVLVKAIQELTQQLQEQNILIQQLKKEVSNCIPIPKS